MYKNVMMASLLLALLLVVCSPITYGASWLTVTEANIGGGIIAAGDYHTVGLKVDGTLLAAGLNDDGQLDVSSWTDITFVASGSYHTVGLKSDGTVVATGLNSFGQLDTTDWSGMVAIAAGNYHTVGVRSDGTVSASGLGSSGQAEVSGWRGIVAVAAGHSHTVGLKNDGTVVAVGSNRNGQLNVAGWEGIIAIAAGYSHTVGLKSDGTVVATGSDSNEQTDVAGWQDIIAVAAGDNHTIGLRSDGTLVAVGSNSNGQLEVSGWKGVAAVAAGDYHTVGLGSNGEVLATGKNSYGQAGVSGWSNKVLMKNVLNTRSGVSPGNPPQVEKGESREVDTPIFDRVALMTDSLISAGYSHTVGLRIDGTVVAVGDNAEGQLDISDWRDIVAVAAGNWHTVGLREDGTVLAVGWNYRGQLDVEDWNDIVAIAAGGYHTMGLRADGRVLAVGRDDNGQLDISGWKDIVDIAAGDYHSVGLKSDGTVVAAGSNSVGQTEVGEWHNIVAIAAGIDHTVGLKSDGTVVAVGYNKYGKCQVGDWQGIVAVAAGTDHTVGLRSDGTVVAAGYNNYGQIDISSWSGIVAICTGDRHTIGLRYDGTVVSAGYLGSSHLEVNDWHDIGVCNVVSGKVALADGTGVADVLIKAGGSETRSDQNGDFKLRISVVSESIIATKEGYSFSSPEIEVKGANKEAFFAALYLVCGSVVAENGEPIQGVMVVAESNSVVTDEEGTFELPASENECEVSFSKAGYSFDPSPVIVTGAVTGLVVRGKVIIKTMQLTWDPVHVVERVTEDGVPRAIIAMEDEQYPSEESSGERMAIQVSLDGRDFVFIIGKGGSDQKLIAEGMKPLWQPRGDLIAFLQKTDGYMHVSVSDDKGNIRQLTEDSHDVQYHSWSPDGKWISFISNRDGLFRLYAVKADGTRMIELTSGDAEVCCCSWNADGWIYFISNSGYMDKGEQLEWVQCDIWRLKPLLP